MREQRSGFVSGNQIFTDSSRGWHEYGGYSGPHARIGDYPWLCPFCKSEHDIKGYDALNHIRTHFFTDVAIQAMSDDLVFSCSADNGKQNIILSVIKTVEYAKRGRTGSPKRFQGLIRKRRPKEAPLAGSWKCTLCWKAHRVSSKDVLDHLCEVLIKQGWWREERGEIVFYIRLKDGKRSERRFELFPQSRTAPAHTIEHTASGSTSATCATSTFSHSPEDRQPEEVGDHLCAAVQSSHDQGTIELPGARIRSLTKRRRLAYVAPDKRKVSLPLPTHPCPHCGLVLKSAKRLNKHLKRRHPST